MRFLRIGFVTVCLWITLGFVAVGAAVAKTPLAPDLQNLPVVDSSLVKMRAVTRGPKFHWFGYYNKQQIDPTGRYLLCQEVDFENRSPQPDDIVKIGMVDLADGDRWIELAESRAWSWQQGCMLQWRPGSATEILFNDREGDRFVCRVLDVKTRRLRTLPMAIEHVSTDGKRAVCADFRRIEYIRAGYGYAGLPDPNRNVLAPGDTGVWSMDLDSGETKFLVSVAQIAKIPYPEVRPTDKHYVNLLEWSSDGKRFLMFDRWVGGIHGQPTRVFTAAADGSDLRLLSARGASHWTWRDPEHVLIWALGGYKIYKDDGSGEPKETLWIAPNGHESYVPGTDNQWLVTDTYPSPSPRREQILYLFHLPTGRAVVLGKFPSPKQYTGEWRCDLHPRVTSDGRRVIIDSPHGGNGRQEYLLEISRIIAGEPAPRKGTVPFSPHENRDSSQVRIIGGEPVSVVDLGGDWDFAYTPARTEDVPPGAAFKVKMPVPGCWDDRFDRVRAEAAWPDARFHPAQPIVFPSADNPPDASLPFLVGTGWYRRTLDVPAAWKDRQVTLYVGRVVMEAWVYVNGNPVHHHLGHSTDWEISLTGKLDVGRPNQLMIAVDNTRTDRTGCVIRGWKGRSGGIYGPVRLRVAGAARIADLFVYPDVRQLRWRAELEGPVTEECRLHWKIIDPRTGRSAGEGRQSAVGPVTEWTTDRMNLEPWSDRQPTLYQIEVELRSGTRVLDVCRQPFGLRRFTVSSTGLRLNGSPVFLRGISDCAYYPLTCTPPTDVDWYRRHFRRMKEIGFNWLRCHTWTPPEPYMQAANELGMLIQVAPPVGYTLPEWRDILRACRKHPSVVIYCCGNEEMLDEAKIEYLRQCAHELRILAPDALFNPQEAMRGVEYGLKPVPGKTVSRPFLHDPERLARLQEFSDVFGSYALGRLSYHSLTGEPEDLDRNLAIYERPCLSHELGICGCYLDLSLEERYRGTRIGPNLYQAARDTLAKAGLLERADLYYRHSAAWQRLILKDALETARQCRLLAGYDCLGANDNHWHRSGYGCGVLNEFDEMKPGRSAEDILSYNGESVLLINRQRQRNLQAGETFLRKLSLSWFGPSALREATVRWALHAADGTALAEGREPVAAAEPGTMAPVLSIEAVLPRVEQPLKTILEVELTAPNTRLRNRWDYWIFPAEAPKEASAVSMVRALDAKTLQDLTAGRRVVLLGHHPFPARALSFQMGLAGRPEGNLATVIARHPLANRFPHDGYCDWQFYPLLDGAAAVQFDALPQAFDPILEVVSSYKRIRRQAALFECRVGAGRLLVCSLNLSGTDPAARYLRNRILDYAGGEQFQPRAQIEPAVLDRLIRVRPPAATSPEATDQGLDPQGQMPK